MPDKLTKPQIRALKVLSGHYNRFQPTELQNNVSAEVADQLVVLGLAERGNCDARFEEWGYPIGYRLTPAGKAAFLARLER